MFHSLSEQMAELQSKLDHLGGLDTLAAVQAKNGSNRSAAHAPAVVASVHYTRTQGALFCLLAIGLVVWMFWHSIHRVIRRKQISAASLATHKMDGTQLRKVIGDANTPAWVNFPDFQRVGYITDVLDQLWPKVSEVCSFHCNLILDPLIRATKPGWVHEVTLLSCDFGEAAPMVTGVKVYKSPQTKGAEVSMEYDFHWNGRQSAKLLIKPLPAKMRFAPTPVVAFLARMFTVKVAIEDIICSGRLRVEGKPLLSTFPVVGAIQASLVEMPKFSFNINVYGGDVTLLPGIETWMNAFIRDQVLRPFILPERVIIPLVPGGGATDWEHRPRGMLFVQLKGATNVPKMDIFGKCDPFVRLYTRDKRKLKSQVKSRTYHPVWEENFQLLVHEPDHQALTCILYDWDRLSPSDEIGRVVIPVRDLPHAEPQDLELEVKLLPKASKGTRKHQTNLQSVRSGVQDGIRKVASQMGLNDPCKLCLQVTYFTFSDHELRALVEDQGPGAPLGRAPAEQGRLADSPVMNYLKGGVLIIQLRKANDLVRKPLRKGGGLLPRRVSVRVQVGPEKKHSHPGDCRASSHSTNFDETLEFVLGADVAGRQDLMINIEVYDDRLKSYCMGRVGICLNEVIRRRRWRDTWALDDVRHGSLQMDLSWLSLLEGA
ncbi:hypothetical protein WJX72_008409 [[Myrmecia] bisecta]|uniref:Uncharacterized protein n=1 Tax=[Myrmecia] bisecta TaxID=41462 RepID=A0AAW1QSI7_9CHLO